MPPSPRPRIAAAVIWLVAPAGYLVLEAIAAAGFPHYSYADNYISDLGARGPRMAVMNTAFYLQGTGFLLGAVLLVRAVKKSKYVVFLGLATANAMGNILVGTFHSAADPTVEGTAWLHTTGAGLAIIGGNVAIVAGSSIVAGIGSSRGYRGVSVALAAFGLLSLLILLAGPSTRTGGWERTSVYTIMGWQMFTAVRLLGWRSGPAAS